MRIRQRDLDTAIATRMYVAGCRFPSSSNPERVSANSGALALCAVPRVDGADPRTVAALFS